MNLSEYLKPALGVAFVVVVGGFYYWFEHRSHPEPKDTPSQALVIVTKSTNACFSDMVRVTGFIVPRREAQVGVDQEGSRVTEVRIAVGVPASPQAGPMFRISVNNEIELEAEVPSVHLLKLNPGATVRISRDDAPDVVGKVRQISPQIDRATQLGKVRITLNNNPSLKVGMFARANIDAKRSCGVAVPRTAIDRLTLQVVRGNTIETRKVRVGLTSDTSTEILEGLEVGETVVADAGTSLHDGDQIKTMFADELERTRTR